MRAFVVLYWDTPRFDQCLLDAIYGLPTFENPDEQSPSHISRHHHISKTMLEGLLTSKLKIKGEWRPLTREILRSVQVTRTTIEGAAEDLYERAFVRLALDQLPLSRIVQDLVPTGTSCERNAARLLDNALAAAVFLNRASDVQAFMELGANASGRTTWFGDTLVVAGSHAGVDVFYLILRATLRSHRNLAISRLIMSLEHAAERGRAALFCPRLWAEIERLFTDLSPSHCFGPALKSAALASQNSTVLAIFELLHTHGVALEVAFSNEFWAETLRIVAANGSICVAQLILGNTSQFQHPGSLDVHLEDACRNGHFSMVRLLISHKQVNSYAGAMYWAARGLHYEILRFLSCHPPRSGSMSVEDALCGAFADRTHLASVMETMSSLTSVDQASREQSFCQMAVRLQLDAVRAHNQQNNPPAETDGDPFQSLLPIGQVKLAQACSAGDFPTFCRLVCAPDEHYAAENYTAGAFSSTINYQRPGMLQFLCEKFPSSKFYLM
ncbi:uncharacterized protein MYCFIDRAFT_177166 [Pseudocercospora fijiensis CIRAD86]|uniref:Ankyrin repeat protein n=1 Tax=Pseudocercospora fijiensis (strain CIRAD86) TaxID=383855 RepID=M3AST9_PSEFD|nr:uncharacterized protein MYCFIDRAFT_177166 [Pseudocercospora fijiensis CIRAD86]EME80198.1 hypothetical protein MYCFIDRAFT_177166 [Pseudocercospora fijiensis CIRAD86]